MNRTEHLLAIVAEECAEVAQRVSKALRFGLLEVQPEQGLNNAERILAEYHDLQAVIGMLRSEGALPNVDGTEAIMAKKAKVERFLLLSEQCGTLDSRGHE